MPKVYVFGAGVDATHGIGMPLNNELLPRITKFLETEKGKDIDAELRTIYPQLRFRFSAFIEKAIDDMARNFNDEVVTIKNRVEQELQDNDHLTPNQQNMGALITHLIGKVHGMAHEAELDDETERLIAAVFGQEMVRDNSIIDLHKVVFSGTFQTVVRLLLTKSLENPNDPILKHMNKDFLDIEVIMLSATRNRLPTLRSIAEVASVVVLRRIVLAKCTSTVSTNMIWFLLHDYLLKLQQSFLLGLNSFFQ